MSKKNLNKKLINNEDIIKIQNEIDNLEKKLFSENIEFSQIYEPSTIPNNQSRLTEGNNSQHIYNIEPNNINYFEQSNVLSIDINNNFKEDEKEENEIKEKEENYKKKEDTNLNKKEIIVDNSSNLKKIRELIELQKEIDLLREKRGKKINDKTKKLNKAYNNKINKKKK